MNVFFSFLNSLRKGNYGLCKTYWKLGVCVKIPLIIGTFASLIFLPILSPLFYGIYLFYVPFYLSGVFNAAKNYSNGFVWKYLAYLSVMMGSYIYLQEWLQIMDTLSVMKSLIH